MKIDLTPNGDVDSYAFDAGSGTEFVTVRAGQSLELPADKVEAFAGKHGARVAKAYDDTGKEIDISKPIEKIPDPGDFTISELEDFIATAKPSKSVLEAMLAMEKAGQKRVGAVQALEGALGL